MTPARTTAAQAPQDLDARTRRLEALETRALAARCLAGIGQLAEVILGPRARHEELLLEALLARTHPSVLEGVRSELLATERELSQRCAALAALERAQLEAAERELALRRELEEARAAQAGLSERELQAPEEREALERAFAEIERELASLRRERDWRSAQMLVAASELEGLRFSLLAPDLQARARSWKAGVP